MTVTTFGVDLSKSAFQVHGSDQDGRVVLRRRLARGQLLAFFTKQPPARIGLEACASARHWARHLSELGHDARLIPAQYVKPLVERNKTDAADAEAICEAVSRPNMHFVPIKSLDQQAVLALHRVRALLVRQRTQLANAIRGLLGEFGIVVARGIRHLPELRARRAPTTEQALPDQARAAVSLIFQQLEAAQDQLEAAEAAILAWHHQSEPIPGAAAGDRAWDRSDHRIGFSGSRRRRTPARLGTALRGMAGADLARTGERRQGEARQDHQGWRSLPADAAYPSTAALSIRSREDAGSKASEGCSRLGGHLAATAGCAATLVGRAGGTATGERRGGRTGAQDCAGGVGDADAPGGLARACDHSRRVTGSAPRSVASDCGGDGG